MFTTEFNTDYFILIIAILLLLGVITTKFSSRLGVPALVLFIALGMVLGSDVSGLIYLDNPNVAQLIGVMALIIILFEGGLNTKWSTVKKVAYPAITLATLGVVLTTTIVALGAKLILGLGWLESFLIGSIVGSTDAAAVFAVVAGKNIEEKMSATVEVESGSNDPMAVFLTISFIQFLTTDNSNIWMLIGNFLWQMGIGLAIGVVAGKLVTKSINKISLDSSGLYPVFAVGFAVLIYSFTAVIHASGLLAVYVAAIIIGNADLTYRTSIVRFNEGFASMAQILMFVILGLLVFPSQLMDWDLIWKGLLLSIILLVVARPVAVFLSMPFFNYNLKEKLFISWAGLRGSVPIVLATFPIVAGVENSQLIFNLVFFVVLTSCLIQGSTISYVATKLGLDGVPKPTSPHTLEIVSMGKANAEMIEFIVSPNHGLIGKPLKNIHFPNNVLINAIIREDSLVTPKGSTEIYAGDILYILTDKKSKNELREMLKSEIIKEELA
jgi:cell volume regulation protein A